MDILGRGGQRGSKWVIGILIGGYLLMSYRVSGGSNGQRGDHGQSRTDQTFSEICISVTRLSKIWFYSFWPHVVLFGELTFKKLI